MLCSFPAVVWVLCFDRVSHFASENTGPWNIKTSKFEFYVALYRQKNACKKAIFRKLSWQETPNSLSNKFARHGQNGEMHRNDMEKLENQENRAEETESEKTEKTEKQRKPRNAANSSASLLVFAVSLFSHFRGFRCSRDFCGFYGFRDFRRWFSRFSCFGCLRRSCCFRMSALDVSMFFLNLENEEVKKKSKCSKYREVPVSLSLQ